MSKEEVIANLQKILAAKKDESREAAYHEAQARELERFREIVRKHLAALSDDLGDFIQTTHGCLFIHGVNVRTVSEYLTAAYECENGKGLAFNLSNLSQSIRSFTKG